MRETSLFRVTTRTYKISDHIKELIPNAIFSLVILKPSAKVSAKELKSRVSLFQKNCN